MFQAAALRAPAAAAARRNLSNCSSGKSQGSVLQADGSTNLNRLYHKGALVLAGVVPLTFALPSSPLTTPVDVLIAVLLPYHSHVAMNYVVSDYIPKGSRPVARAVVLATSIIAAAGLLKLSIQGPGIGASVKALWNKPAEKK